jgi:hypothetical protein
LLRSSILVGDPERVLRLENGKIIQEIGLDDGVTALDQLCLIKRIPFEWVD